MNRFYSVLLMSFIACGVSIHALAVCSPPKAAGAVICFPTPNATVTGDPVFEVAATGEGSPITRMVLYGDGAQILSLNQNSFSLAVYGGDIKFNGRHFYTLKAWDQAGHVFQTSEYLTEFDSLVPQCKSPAAGFKICNPTQGSYQWNNTQLIISGAANIASYTVFLNGVQQGTSFSGPTLNGLVASPTTGKPITLKVVAKTTAGATTTQTLSYRDYFENPACGRSSCGPGLVINSPGDYEDVISPIVVNAEVQGNSSPIKTMQAYLDGKLVASSTGPTLRHEVPAPHGTHLLVIQGYDTKNVMYRVRQNVNVQ